MTDTDRNKQRILIALILAAVLIVLATGWKTRAHTPETLGAAFCEAMLRGNDNSVYKLLSADTRRIWDEADRHNTLIARARPDEKPPLGDGMPVQAFPDLAPGCTAGAMVTRGETSTIDISHRFPDQPKADWTDRLVVVQEGKGWKVADILFPPHGRNGMRRALEDTLETPVPPAETKTEAGQGL